VGIINGCDSCELEGKFRWRVPEGFVSGFGENRDGYVKIVLYYKDNESESYYSDYFTISKRVSTHTNRANITNR